MKISRNELKKLIEQELKEYSVGAGAGPPSFAQGKNPDDLGHRGSQKDQVKQYIAANWENEFVREDLAAGVDALDPDGQVRAYGLMKRGDKVGLVDLLLPGGGPPEGVDPHADTVAVAPLDATQPLPSIRREGKKINKSDLQQIIVQELKSILKED